MAGPTATLCRVPAVEWRAETAAACSPASCRFTKPADAAPAAESLPEAHALRASTNQQHEAAKVMPPVRRPRASNPGLFDSPFATPEPAAQLAQQPRTPARGPARSVFFLPFTIQPRCTLLSCLLFLAYFVLILQTFRAYGITWDEDWHHTYGKALIRWYGSGFRDGSSFSEKPMTQFNYMYYGGFPHIIIGLISVVFPEAEFEAGHFVIAIFGFIGVLFAFHIGRLIAGKPAGLVASLFLICTPRFYGHSFTNIVDITLASFYCASIYCIVKTLFYLPNPPKRLVTLTGISIGLKLAIRIISITPLAYLGLAFFLWFFETHAMNRKVVSRSVIVASAAKLLSVYLTILMLAYLVMVAWWPAAQINPVMQPIQALLFSNDIGSSVFRFDDHLEFGVMPMLFEGTSVLSNDLPWYYELKWFAITLPEFYFIALVIGLLLAARVIRRGGMRLDAHSVRPEG